MRFHWFFRKFHLFLFHQIPTWSYIGHKNFPFHSLSHPFTASTVHLLKRKLPILTCFGFGVFVGCPASPVFSSLSECSVGVNSGFLAFLLDRSWRCSCDWSSFLNMGLRSSALACTSEISKSPFLFLNVCRWTSSELTNWPGTGRTERTREALDFAASFFFVVRGLKS